MPLVVYSCFCNLQQDVEGAPVAQESHKGETFIALQLPNTHYITENMANQLFDVLEKGSESWLLLFVALVYGAAP